MRCISWRQYNQKTFWTLYHYEQNKWVKEHTYFTKGSLGFYAMLCHEHLTLKWACMPLDRYCFYLLKTYEPQLHTVVLPSTLQNVLHGRMRQWVDLNQEVAASMDQISLEQWRDINMFLTDFYRCTKQEEASTCYEAWQLERSLTNVWADQLIELIEQFHDEIFAYFKNRTLFDSLME